MKHDRWVSNFACRILSNRNDKAANSGLGWRLPIPAWTVPSAILSILGLLEVNHAVLGQSNSNGFEIVEPGPILEQPAGIDGEVVPEEPAGDGQADANAFILEPDERSGPIAHNDPRIKAIDPDLAKPIMVDLYSLTRNSYSVYRGEDDSTTFLPGDGDQFGWLSFLSSNYLPSQQKYGPTLNFNLHLLSGPNSVDLPPRLYDFELGFQSRRSLSELFSYDCSATLGVYSDFEDSARDGVRFPSHAVGICHAGPRIDWVLGVDYLSRDDIKLLPVFGMCWHDPEQPALRYEMVFPRPRVDFVLSDQSRLYSAGTLGGGTWDIEFPDQTNDVMTYRDYRWVIGVEQANRRGGLSAWELGWVFGRTLEFRSQTNENDFDDAFIIRFVTRH